MPGGGSPVEASQTETRMVTALHAKIVARFGEEPPCGVHGVAQLLQACDFIEEQAWSHLTEPGFRWQVYADRGGHQTPPSADGESSYAEDSVSPLMIALLTGGRRRRSFEEAAMAT